MPHYVFPKVYLMLTITLISTMHRELGKCNADELCKILESERPEVIFLEALEDTYSQYQKENFASYGVYHRQLEIEAIQKYSNYNPIKYIPVLDDELTDLLEEKYEAIPENSQLRRMQQELAKLSESEGFPFLNSQSCMTLHAKMRALENRLLNNDQLDEALSADIDAYENAMMRNIYSYCQNNQLSKAVFMCGSAHRQSIIEKITYFQANESVDINWSLYGNRQ
jgi:hypothetical protein